MRRIMLFLAPPLLAIVAFAIVVFWLNRDFGKGALQVTATPKSKVYLNNQLVGETPLCKCEGQEMLRAGEYALKLVPQEGDFLPYEEKVTIGQSVLTVVDKTFGQGALGSGRTITLSKLEDKKAVELLVLSFPQDAQVFIDNSSLGKTPINTKTLTVSDHEVKLTKDGYSENVIRIRTVAGYKITLVASLGVLPDLSSFDASSSALQIASSSAIPETAKVIILQTPTGFLRVRESGSLTAQEIERVTPGEIFDLVDEKEGWFEIKLTDGKTGWISSQYAKKQ